MATRSYLRTPLLVASLLAAVTACAADDEVLVGQQHSLLESAHPALHTLPNVERLTMGAANRTAFVSGQLGAELDSVGAAFEIAEGALHLKNSEQDELGQTVERYGQERNGLEVIGGDLRITRDADGEIRSATGTSWAAGKAPFTPTFAQADARDAAMAVTEGADGSSSGRLVYIASSKGTSPELAWHFVLTGNRAGMPVEDDVYINALSGELADRAPRIHSARLRTTYNAAGTEDYGTIARSETTPATGDSDIDQAHDAAGKTYDCLQDLFGRDSYDNAGAGLVSIANFGVGFENAFWNGSEMVYGDGFTVLDIGTHELGHAVTEYTGNMVYQNEPGALNEAWSDILSAVCDAYANGGVSNNTWTLAEDLPGIGALRFFSNPTQDGQSSDHYSSRYLGTEDEGGVHLNSGIANLAFYLATQGGVHPRGISTTLVEGVGIDTSGKIFYRALSNYMNVNTDFLGARVATELAAEDLYGAGSPESISMSEAWSAVGVGGPAPERQAEPEPEEPSPENPDVPGQDDGTGPQAGTGTVIGGCSTSSGTGGAASGLLLMLLALVATRRRKED